MISGIDSASEQFLEAVAQVQARMDRAQRQIASGLRVTSASDAPGEIADILQLQTEVARNRQIQTNLGRLQTEVDGGSNALNGAVQLMDRAQVIASEATGPLQNGDTRMSLAQEVQSLMEQMVAASATSVEGRYIFSGDQDGSPAYALDLNAPTGVDRLLNVQAATRQLEDAAGTRFAVAKTAQEIFDLRDANDAPAIGNVFAALASLRMALLANDPDAVRGSIPALQAASQHLNLELSFYGAAQNRVSAATDLSHTYDTNLASELSQKRDSDVTAAIVELTQAQTQLQAALGARAKMPQHSLFDYLA